MKKGEKHGFLTAVKPVKQDKNGNFYWEFNCDCGETKVIRANSVKAGEVKSCGCYHRAISREVCIKRNTTHGMSGTRVYNIWCGMWKRCTNKKTEKYPNYGGRGITICDEWKKFENFYKDMGEPGETLSIDRINNDGNYEPSNCKWSTAKEQRANQRPYKKYKRRQAN